MQLEFVSDVGEETMGELELCLNEQCSCLPVFSQPISVSEEPMGELELCLNEQSSCPPVVSDPLGEEPVGELELCLNEQSFCLPVVSDPLGGGEESIDELELCLNEQSCWPPVVSSECHVRWGSLYFGDRYTGLYWLSAVSLSVTVVIIKDCLCVHQYVQRGTLGIPLGDDCVLSVVYM